MDDLRIIELYFDRNEQAITETDTKYGKLCHSIAYNILNNHEDSKECVNVNASHDPARWVEAEWSDTVNSSYNGSIQILAQDRHNLLADLMSYLSAQKVTVCALNAKVNNNQTCSIELTLQVANKQELDWVIKQIAKRQDTIEIFRV